MTDSLSQLGVHQACVYLLCDATRLVSSIAERVKLHEDFDADIVFDYAVNWRATCVDMGDSVSATESAVLASILIQVFYKLDISKHISNNYDLYVPSHPIPPSLPPVT